MPSATRASALPARSSTSRRLGGADSVVQMFEYLRRLATTGAAYTASSVVSKLIAVFLLPIYTHYLTPSDYGAAEVMLASVIAASIVVRFGVIEAILRFYYLAGERPERVVSTGFAALFWGATAAAAIALPFAGADLARRCSSHDRRRAGPARDPRPLDADAVRVRAHPAAPRRARARLLRDHGRQRPGDDPVHRLAGRRPGRAGERHPARHLRHRRRCSWSGCCGASAAGSRCVSGPGRSCGGCSASGCRRCRPSCRSTRSTSSTGSSSSALAGLAEAGLYALAVKFAQGDERARPRLPARLAAARLLDPRTTTRRGAPTR